MKLNRKNFLPLLGLVTLVLGAGWALAPASKPAAPPAPASPISSSPQKRLGPTTLLALAAPGGIIARADQYFLAALKDHYYVADAGGQNNLVVAIAYLPAVSGQDVPEIPPFLEHNVGRPPTVLFSNGQQSIASGATHLPCSLVGFSTQMLFQYVSAAMTCPDRTQIQTILLVFPAQQESQALELLLDGGKYVVVLQ